MCTKTSTLDTYSALPSLKNFISGKNWSQDPIFVVTSFLSILSTFSESKNKKKKSKNSKKQRQPKNREKRGAKVKQYLEEHIESAIWAALTCADDCLVPNHISTVHIT